MCANIQIMLHLLPVLLYKKWIIFFLKQIWSKRLIVFQTFSLQYFDNLIFLFSTQLITSSMLWPEVQSKVTLVPEKKIISKNWVQIKKNHGANKRRTTDQPGITQSWAGVIPRTQAIVWFSNGPALSSQKILADFPALFF